MMRGLPYSLAVHTIALVLVFLFGNHVSRRPMEPPRSIRVKMVHLPQTRPVEEPEPEPAIRTPQPRETQPELPPKEVPEPKPEPKKPEPEKPQVEPRQPEPEPEPEVQPDEPEPADVNRPVSLGPSVQGTDSDFPFAWYLARVEGLIARSWNPRQLGFGKRALVSCAVHFQVAKGGAVSRVTLLSSSGTGVFDREALRAVQTTRLPPLPPQYSGSSLGVTFIFNLEPGS